MGSQSGRRSPSRRSSGSSYGSTYKSLGTGRDNRRTSSGGRSPAARRRRRRKRLIKALAAWAFCILCVALIAGGTLRLVQSAATSKMRGFRQEGLEKLEAKDYTGAMAAFDQALEASNKKNKDFNSDVLLYRAEAELFLKDHKAALNTYDRLAEIDPEQLSYQYMRSICYARLGDTDQAYRIFMDTKAKDNTDKPAAAREEALTAVGSACVKAEQYERAMTLYEEALKEGTENGQIYNQMGLCQMAKEEYEGALDSFNKGYDSLVTSYNAGSGAGLSQAMAAIPPERETDIELLKELAYNRAAASEYLQKYDAALDQFEAYIEAFGPDERAQHEIDFLKTR